MRTLRHISVFLFVLAFANCFAQTYPLLELQSGHSARVNSITVSPDEELMATLDQSGMAIIWDVHSGLQLQQTDKVRSVNFYKKDQLLIEFIDGSVWLQDAFKPDSKEEIDEIKGAQRIKLVGSSMVLCSKSGKGMLYQNGEGHFLDLKLRADFIASKTIDDEVLVRTGDSLVVLNSSTKAIELISSKRVNRKIEQLEVAGNNFMARTQTSLYIIDKEHWKKKHFYNTHSFRSKFMSCYYNDVICAVQNTGQLDVFDKELSLSQSFHAGLLNARAVQLIDQGRVALVARGTEVLMIDVKSGKWLKTFQGKTSALSFATFTKNEEAIVVGYKDGGIRYVPMNPLSTTFFMQIPPKTTNGKENWEITLLGASSTTDEIKLSAIYTKKTKRKKRLKKSVVFDVYWSFKEGRYWVDEVENIRHKKKDSLTQNDVADSRQIQRKLQNIKNGVGITSVDNSILLSTDENVSFEIMVFGNDGTLYKRDNYYFSQKGLSEYLAFRKDDALYPFEQFDPYLNNPFEVFKDLHLVDDQSLDLFHRSQETRLKHIGNHKIEELDMNDVPQLAVKRSSQNVVDDQLYTFEVQVEGTEPLTSFHVEVNDVPLYGKSGKQTEGKLMNDKVVVSLLQGMNNFSVYAFDEKESMSNVHKFSVYCNHLSEPELYIVAVGISNYENADFRLDYASKDATDFVDLFDNNKLYKETHTLLFNDAKKENLLSLTQEFLSSAKTNDVILFYYAGHGVLNQEYKYFLCPADVNFEQPNINGIEFDRLENILSDLDCRNRVVILDACHSGEIDSDEIAGYSDRNEDQDIKFRSSGNTIHRLESGVSYLDLSKMLFEDTRTNHGNVVISSASGVEFAMESGKWNNGLFTYFLKDGINSFDADLNGDHKIFLHELFYFVSREVVQASKGLQNPRIRTDIETVNPNVR